VHTVRTMPGDNERRSFFESPARECSELKTITPWRSQAGRDGRVKLTADHNKGEPGMEVIKGTGTRSIPSGGRPRAALQACYKRPLIAVTAATADTQGGA